MMDMPTRRWWGVEDRGSAVMRSRQLCMFHDELRLYMWYQNTEHIGQPRLLHSGSVCNIHQMKMLQIFCRFFVDSMVSMVSPLVFIFCQPGYKATPFIFMCGIYFVLLLCLSFLCVWCLSSNVYPTCTEQTDNWLKLQGGTL